MIKVIRIIESILSNACGLGVDDHRNTCNISPVVSIQNAPPTEVAVEVKVMRPTLPPSTCDNNAEDTHDAQQCSIVDDERCNTTAGTQHLVAAPQRFHPLHHNGCTQHSPLSTMLKHMYRVPGQRKDITIRPTTAYTMCAGLTTRCCAPCKSKFMSCLVMVPVRCRPREG